MSAEELILIAMIRELKGARTPIDQWIALRRLLQALTAATRGGTPPTLCPVHVTLEIGPLQDTSEALQ